MIFDLQRFVEPELYLATANDETVNVYKTKATRRAEGATSDTTLKPKTRRAPYAGANAGAGNDYVSVGADAEGISIQGGKGNDTIDITGNTKGNTYIYEYGEGYDTVLGWNADKDKFSIDGAYGNSGYQTLMSQDGNDFIIQYGPTGKVTFKDLNHGDRVMIKGSSGEMHFAKVEKIMQGNVGNNEFLNTEDGYNHKGNSSSDYWVIDGSYGNDTIYNDFDYVSIAGGEGRDNIIIGTSTLNAHTVTSGVTIYGGEGSDTIDVSADTVASNGVTLYGGHLYQFGYNDGYATIIGFNGNDTIDFLGVDANNISAEIKSGGNFVIESSYSVTETDADNNEVTTNYFTYITIVKPEDADLAGTKLNLQIDGIPLTDEQYSAIGYVTKNGDNYEIAKYILLSNAAESVSYNSDYNNYTIDAASGADYLTISGSAMSINGGESNDRILILSSNNTIVGGSGSDYIANLGNNQVYEFGAEDGTDYILNFTDNSTIKAIYDNSTINSQEITSDGVKLQFSFSSTIFSTYVIIKGTLIEDNLPAQPATPLNTEDENSVAEWDAYNSAYNDYIFRPYNYRVIPDNSTIFIETSNGTTTFTTPQLFYVNGTFNNTVDNCLIECSTSDNNTITNYGNNVTINANLNTTVEDFGSDTTINRVNLYRGTNGNDTINNSTSYVSIIAGFGDDSIYNTGERVSIHAGYDNTTITNTGNYVSINGYNSNNTISNEGANVTIWGGTGDDSILNSGDNVIIYPRTGNDTIINTGKTIDFYGNYDGDKFISNTAVGNTTTATIKCGSGNDTVYNTSDYVSISAGDGNNSITNAGNFVTIDSGSGADTITNTGSNVSIGGGYGNDTITNTGDNVTINGGSGDDSISNSGTNTTYIFGTSVGADTITGFNQDTDLIHVTFMIIWLPQSAVLLFCLTVFQPALSITKLLAAIYKLIQLLEACYEIRRYKLQADEYRRIVGKNQRCLF